MLDRQPGSTRPGRRTTAVAGALTVLSLAVAGCSASSTQTAAKPGTGSAVKAGSGSASPSPTSTPTPREPQAKVVTHLPRRAGRTLHVSDPVRFQAKRGSFATVAVTVGDSQRRLPGSFNGSRTRWHATGRLEPGTTYQVKAVAKDTNGLRTTRRQSFRTEALSLDQQTYPSLAPLPGETVGVGMPVIVHFDVPVTDKASIERHLSVQSTPRQRGSWHWMSDYEVHWRPAHYWKPGTKVTVHADIDSIPAGNGIWGQLSRSATFTVGDKVVSYVNVATHQMKTYVNGNLARTIPITAGMPGFTTRSGIKVIIEKFLHKRMDAATVGLSKNDPNYYNIPDVQYAMRVTYSGEFLHAAPWSVGSQGYANVSHGCVGMSTDNAAWLYGITKRGDVVDVTGTDRGMELDNGYGDWNESFRVYRQGSALH